MQPISSNVIRLAVAGVIFCGLTTRPVHAVVYSGGPGGGYGAAESAQVSLGAAALSVSMPADIVIERTLQSVACPVLTIQDATPAAIGTIGGLRLSISSSVPVHWDSSVVAPVFGGSAAAKVAAQVQYDDNDRTLVMTVDSDFMSGDTLTVDGLAFTNLVAACPPVKLALDIAGDGVPDAYTENRLSVTVPRPGGLGSGDTGYAMTEDVKLIVPQATLLLLR